MRRHGEGVRSLCAGGIGVRRSAGIHLAGASELSHA